ncbi:MAG TPA: acyl-CoA dehydrogenase family protein [Hyphomonas sp.]|nr:acyl-CoA dehydrogenase family protein [Hyphomonas sp.]
MLCQFQPEAEHLDILRNSLRRFLDRHAPCEKTRIWEKNREFARDAFAHLAELGVCGLTIDEEHGGVGRDLVAAVLVIEELCRTGVSLAGPYIQCAFYGGVNISEKGSARQKAELLPSLARGELIFAYGLTEPNTGADLASVSTRAERRPDGSVLINGTKRWCTAAEYSDYIYCLVKSDSEAPRYRNLSFVLIPSDAPGVTIQPIEHAGMGYAHSSDVIFENVVVSEDLIVGGPESWNKGWPMLVGPALDVEKLEIAAMAYGLAKAVVEKTRLYAAEREQFGRAIFGHQAVAHAIAMAETKLLACRHMLYHAAWLANEGVPCSKETSMAKLFVSETAVEIGLSCQKILGAYGFSDEYDVVRLVGDLLLLPVIGGSTNIQLNNISKQLIRA